MSIVGLESHNEKQYGSFDILPESNKDNSEINSSLKSSSSISYLSRYLNSSHSPVILKDETWQNIYKVLKPSLPIKIWFSQKKSGKGSRLQKILFEVC